MVIAGGPPRSRRVPRSDGSFNGAGDGDRRRVEEQIGVIGEIDVASTEPAMVIAGGGETGRGVHCYGLLQRSRRW